MEERAAPELGGSPDIAQVAMSRRPIRLDWGTQRLRLRFGEVSMLVQLIQGTFPNYHQLIPTGMVTSVTVLAEEMERDLRQVRRVSKEGSNIVRLRWEGERLLVSTRAEEVGETTVPAPPPPRRRAGPL